MASTEAKDTIAGRLVIHCNLVMNLCIDINDTTFTRQDLIYAFIREWL